MTSVRLLRAMDRTETPWKNGAGTAREVITFPDVSDFETFEWRITLAQLRANCPFSYFPNVDRCLAVFEGRLGITVGEAELIELPPGDDPLHFPGDVPTRAHLLAAPVTYLNLMTRRSVYRGTMTPREITTPERFDAKASFTVFLARGAVKIEHAHGTSHLAPLDAAVVTGGGPLNLSAPSPAVECYIMELFKRT